MPMGANSKILAKSMGVALDIDGLERNGWIRFMGCIEYNEAAILARVSKQLDALLHTDCAIIR
jgi:hypothetical protein